LIGGCANARTDPPAASSAAASQSSKSDADKSAKADENKDVKGDDKSPKSAADRAKVRNNAASLLHDLLGQEKDVSKILIIKHEAKEFGQLVKDISKTSGDGAKQLEKLAKNDPGLDLMVMDLPPGERAARDAQSKTDEHELLHSSGTTFEFNLLLTQVQALDYAAHLAQVAAENSTSPDQAHEFSSLQMQLNQLLSQAVKMMRAPPRKQES
jgi:hypothetical protein